MVKSILGILLALTIFGCGNKPQQDSTSTTTTPGSTDTFSGFDDNKDDDDQSTSTADALKTAKEGLQQAADTTTDSKQSQALKDAIGNLSDWEKGFRGLYGFRPQDAAWLDAIFNDATSRALVIAGQLEEVGLTQVAKAFRDLATKYNVYRITLKDGRFIFSRDLNESAKIMAANDYTQFVLVLRLYKKELAPYSRAIYRCYIKDDKPHWLVTDADCDKNAKLHSKSLLGYSSNIAQGIVKYTIYRVSHPTRGDLVTLSEKSNKNTLAIKNGGWKDRGILGYTEN